MTNKQMQHKQRTLYDWAESEGWTELRYDVVDLVWRGFPPGALTEETVSRSHAYFWFNGVASRLWFDRAENLACSTVQLHQTLGRM